MTTLRKNIIIGLTVLGLGAASFTVQAQEAQPGMHAKWAERAAQHQRKLHDLLKLTPSQDSAWASYTASARSAHPRAGHGERGAWKTMTAPQRMEKHIEMAKQHIATMETRLAALNSFYAVLTPEQKKLFDAHSMGHGGEHGRQLHRPG